MLSRTVINIVKRSVYNNTCMLYWIRGFSQLSSSIYSRSIKQYTMQDNYNLYLAKRFKSNKKKTADNKKHMNEDSDKKEDDEEEAPVGSKIYIGNVQSLRLDLISKVGFGMSRNKIDEVFYGSKIRVNGKKVLKKSIEVHVGDEIDLILHRNIDNPAFLVVNRIIVLSMDPAVESIRIKLSRDKNLLIEDYEDPWLSS